MAAFGKNDNEDYYEYISKIRWISYFHQIEEILNFEPNSILEIGSGMGVLKVVLKEVLNQNIETMDLYDTFKPDHIGSVTAIPFPDNVYDVVSCFQVLEHLPFDDLEKGLSEMMRVSSKAVIISLPNANRPLRIHFSIKNINIIIKKFILKNKIKSKNHFWEINLKGYDEKKIRKLLSNIAIKNNFTLSKDFRVIETPFHHFFIFTKNI